MEVVNDILSTPITNLEDQKESLPDRIQGQIVEKENMHVSEESTNINDEKETLQPIFEIDGTLKTEKMFFSSETKTEITPQKSIEHGPERPNTLKEDIALIHLDPASTNPNLNSFTNQPRHSDPLNLHRRLFIWTSFPSSFSHSK